MSLQISGDGHTPIVLQKDGKQIRNTNGQIHCVTPEERIGHQMSQQSEHDHRRLQPGSGQRQQEQQQPR